MTLWFTSDTHFDHAKIIEYSRRPFSSVAEMNDALVANWNVHVQPGDTVWHLGDIAFRSKRPAEYWLRALAGHIHVCIGNHDDPKELAASRAVSVQDVKYLRHEKQKLWLSHYAHRVWRNSNHGSFHLFGHSHGDLLTRGSGRLMDVGVDAVATREGMVGTNHVRPGDYRPISFDEVMAQLAYQLPTDHHG